MRDTVTEFGAQGLELDAALLAWGTDLIREIAWYQDNAAGKSRPVGEKAPNPWGFHDLLGNVWEWCHDCFFRSCCEAGCRAVRGGSCRSSARFCRSAQRWGVGPHGRSRYVGLRVLAAKSNVSWSLYPPLQDMTLRPPSLCAAIDADDFELAGRIVRADPDEIDFIHVVPPVLHGCVYEDRPEWVEWLLDHGADIESRDQDYGATPLTAAVIHQQKRIIPILVRRNASTRSQLKRARDGLAAGRNPVPVDLYWEAIRGDRLSSQRLGQVTST